MTIQTAHPLTDDREDGRLTSQNNRLTGACLPILLWIRDWGGEVREQSKKAF